MDFPLEALVSFIASIAFYLLLITFVVHAFVLAFHWFSYGASRSASILALAIYLNGAMLLFLAMSFFLMSPLF